MKLSQKRNDIVARDLILCKLQEYLEAKILLWLISPCGSPREFTSQLKFHFTTCDQYVPQVQINQTRDSATLRKAF